MTTVIDSLAAGLAAVPEDTSLCVGLSGGLDSVVLLHALAQLPSRHRIRALHINHQLSQFAQQWQQHCADYCESLKMDFAATSVDVKNILGDAGSGVEAMARRLRYEAFANHLQENEVLLLAHHMDDQLETFLLRLMRGAGVHGLSAMPVSRAVGPGRLLRPLLNVTRQQLLDYAESNALVWVEDDSNSDSRFDRNFCRHEIFPVVAQRWPKYRESWGKSLQLIAEAAEVVAELGAQDVENATANHAAVLSLRSLATLSRPRQCSALRHWLSRLNAPELGWKPLNELMSKLEAHRGNGQTLSVSADFQLVAYRDELHALRRLPPPLPPEKMWRIADAEVFPLPNNGELALRYDTRLSECFMKLGDVSVRYRQGGERCKIAGRPTKSLKQLLQEAAVPPWLRDRLPLIYFADSLVYIPMVGACESFGLPKRGEVTEASIVWRQPEFNWLESSKSD